MNRKLAITAIVLVAVVMGLSSVVPMMPMAYAGVPLEGACPADFVLMEIISIEASIQARAIAIDEADGVPDELVCTKRIFSAHGHVRTIIIDNNIPISTGPTG